VSARARRSLLGAGLAALALLVLIPDASADRPMPPGGITFEVLDSAGNPVDRAGVAPDRLITRLGAATGPEAETARDLEIGFPPGMGGDPKSVPVCTRASYDSPELCPEETRVGTMTLILGEGGGEALPIYNLEPVGNQVTAFGVGFFGFLFKFSSHLRPDDLGLSTTVEALPQSGEPSNGIIFEFWGVPADHQQGTSLPRRAFLTTPTRCGEPLSVTIRQRTWEQPDEWAIGSADTGVPLTGCGALPFTPVANFALEKPIADSPTGFELNLKFPAAATVDGPVASQAKATSIQFPEGMGISPGAARHLTACSDAQLGRGTERAAACPRSSKVGSVEIGAPQLNAPLSGSVYLGAEKGEERFRLFVVAAGPGTEAKFIGSMRPDPVTGRLTTTLNDLPQVAFGNLTMRFDGGPGALFVAPPSCGPATVIATVTPYSGTPPVTTSASVPVGPAAGRQCGVPGPFAPSLTAAISARRAGAPTSFSSVIVRRDGEQLTDRFAIAFPPGLSADLASVPFCPDAAANSGTCTAASQIGSAFVDIGSGSETAELSGNAYLTGPSGRDPFGVVMSFDAAVGPFHLGTFNVRSGMRMDPLTGQVSVQTGSLPQSFQGIPVRFQRIGLEIDRPGFMRAPTSCTPKSVKATVTSTEGTVARPSSALSLSGCVKLPFHPGFSLALTDRSQLHRRGKPGMQVRMRAKPGEANMRGAAMILPAPIRFNPGALVEICSRRDAFRGRCPKKARIGTGFARTPLLAKPLKGAIYVVQPQGKGEPEIWTQLKGDGIELNLRSTSATVHGHVEARFEGVPDMPLSSFTMEFADHGILTLQRDLCVDGRTRVLSAPTKLEGHNGALRQRRIPVRTPELCPAR
jgi:hypothetical protein